MSEQVIALKSNALTTLDRVKQMLGIPNDDVDQTRDSIIASMINSASAWFESQTGRKFKQTTYTERYQGSSSQELCLRQYPIVEIESVTDASNNAIIDASQYSIEDTGHIGIVWKDDGWGMRALPYGLASDPLFSRSYIEVKYKAGYILPKDATAEDPATLPSDIEAVIWEMAQQQYKLMQDGAFNLTSFSISDVSWTWDKEQKQSWLDTIATHKRWM